jgi:hypothetical protein
MGLIRRSGGRAPSSVDSPGSEISNTAIDVMANCNSESRPPCSEWSERQSTKTTTGEGLTQERKEPGKHASEEQLHSYVYGRLTAIQTKDLESHLSECKECTRGLSNTLAFFRNFSELRSQDGSSGERRGAPRFSTEGLAKIQSLSPFNSAWSNVSIVDISKDGMKLETTERWSVGVVIRIRLNSTFILSEVRYCSPSGGKFYVGVRIQDVYCGPPFP